MKVSKILLGPVCACSLAVVFLGASYVAAQSRAGVPQAQKPLSSDNWSYPDSLDAPVASPEQYKVLYDDVAVRLLEVTVAPGQKEKMHADRWPAVLVLDTPATKIRRQGNDGAVRELNPANDKPLNGPLPVVVRVPPAAPHADENVDAHTRHYYRVEFRNSLKFALYDIPNGPSWADTGLPVPTGDPSYPKQVVEDPTPQFADRIAGLFRSRWTLLWLPRASTSSDTRTPISGSSRCSGIPLKERGCTIIAIPRSSSTTRSAQKWSIDITMAR